MKKIILFAIIVLVVAGGVWGFLKNKKDNTKEVAKTEETQSEDENGTVQGATTIKTTPGSDIILFIGEGCPHCKKVEDYIKANKIDEKINFDLKEIWYNKDNAAVMKQKADICKIPEDQLGVPLLFDGTKCYVGEVEISDFFNSKINAQ